MATIDQQFIEFIVKTLVNNPDEVTVDRDIDERGVLLTLTVNPEDVGRVIGKRGATAQSIRTLLRVLGTKNDARYNLKIVNTDNYDPAEHTAGKPIATAALDPDEDAEADAAEAYNDAKTEEAEVAEDAAAGEDIVTEDDDTGLAARTRAEMEDLDDIDI